MKMKTKVVSILAACALLAAVAWFAQAPSRAQSVAVPEKYRETIRKGLDYLAGKQHKDGHWEGDAGTHPVAMTGLAGLAFLMEQVQPDRGGRRVRGENKLDEKRLATIRKAADWLIAQSKPDRDGLIFSGHDSETTRYMLGHGLATIFLAGVLEHETDAERRKKLTEVLTRAVKYIASAQSSQGGWHDTSKVEGHDFAAIPATVIQIQALRAAETAGIPVYPALHDGPQWLKASLEKNSSPSDTAAALACLSRNEPGMQAKLSPKWIDRCRSGIPVGSDLKLGRDEFAHYYFGQTEFNRGGDFWIAYRTAMFDRLRAAQNEDGSWPAGNGTCTGQVYSTAVWCTLLQLDNDSHPSKLRILLDVL